MGDDELYQILQLNEHVLVSTCRMMMLQRSATNGRTPELFSSEPGESNRSMTPWRHVARNMGRRWRRRRRRRRRPGPYLQCTECGTRETPQWRDGDAGKGTLCNVCGLLYAKRRSRVRRPDMIRCLNESCAGPKWAALQERNGDDAPLSEMDTR